MTKLPWTCFHFVRCRFAGRWLPSNFTRVLKVSSLPLTNMAAFERMAESDRHVMERHGPRPKPYPSGGLQVPTPVVPAFNLHMSEFVPAGQTMADPNMDAAEAEMLRTEMQKQARRESIASNKKMLCKTKGTVEDRDFIPPKNDLWQCVNTSKGRNCAPGGYKPPNVNTAEKKRGRFSIAGVELDEDGFQKQWDGCPVKPPQKPGKCPETEFRQVSKKMSESWMTCDGRRRCNKNKGQEHNAHHTSRDTSYNTGSFEGRMTPDDFSIGTTDTQKLMAILRETSEPEGLEGCSITSSMGPDCSSPCESVFEGPARTSLRQHKTIKIKTVKKKPSPIHLSRMERKFTAPCPEPEIDPPCGKPPGITIKLQNEIIQPSKNICRKNDEMRPPRSQRSCRQTGYIIDHNADCLPPVVHLAQLGPPDRTCCMPNNDACAAPGVPAGDHEDHHQEPPGNVKPWKPGEQNKMHPENELNNDNQRPNTVGKSRPNNDNNTPYSSKPNSARQQQQQQQQQQNKPGKGCAGLPMEPCDIISWENEGRGNSEPMSLVPSVFAQDMTKPVHAMCRGTKLNVMNKVAGDPSIIKKTGNGGRRKNRADGPPILMDADELMAMEGDLNDQEQLEDSKRLGIFLNADLKTQHFTDVNIHAKDQTYKIHKEYLLAFTSYDIPVIEGQPLREQPTLDLSELDGADVAAVLHFLYYGELKCNIYNILGVMAAANALGLVDIPQVLRDYHDKLFAPPNQTNIIDFAVCKKMDCLAGYTWKIFVASFYHHINGSHFLDWDVRWVVNLLSHEDIPIKSELEVFEAARMWLNFRAEERADHVKAVFTCVRWTYMTADEMVSCEREDPCLMNRPEAHELVADANWYKIMIGRGKNWSEFNIKPPRGAYAGRDGAVAVPPRPAGLGAAPSGSDLPRVKSAHQDPPSAPKSNKGASNKTKPRKNHEGERDHHTEPHRENRGAAGEGRAYGKAAQDQQETKLREDLARLPVPPESDLFSVISFGSLEVDLSCTDDEDCKDDIRCF